MSEKEATEKQITETLEKIMTTEGVLKNPTHTIKFLAKILFNLRFDLDELKVKLYETIMGEEECEVNHKPEEEDGRFYS